MIITLDTIKALNPCEHGIQDFERKHPEYSNTLSHLLALEDISYSNKIWLATKVVDTAILKQWAVECAESVVDNYNSRYPGDDRVSKCIETTKRYLVGEATIDELNNAWSAESARYAVWYADESAMYAVWYADESAMYAARSATRSARAAAESAESAAAESAMYAARSATRSATRSARYAARSARAAAESAESAGSAGSAGSEQKDINLSLLIALLGGQ